MPFVLNMHKATIDDLVVNLYGYRSAKAKSPDTSESPSRTQTKPNTYTTSLLPSTRSRAPPLKVLIIVFGIIEDSKVSWDHPTPVRITGTVYQPTTLPKHLEDSFDVILLTSSADLTEVNAVEAANGGKPARAVITISGTVANLSHPKYDAWIIDTEGGCERWLVGCVFASTFLRIFATLIKVLIISLLCEALPQVVRDDIALGDSVTFTGSFAGKAPLPGSSQPLLMFDPVFFKLKRGTHTQGILRPEPPLSDSLRTRLVTSQAEKIPSTI